jgi:hypothetical protein
MGIGPFDELEVTPPNQDTIAQWVRLLKDRGVPVVNGV